MKAVCISLLTVVLLSSCNDRRSKLRIEQPSVSSVAMREGADRDKYTEEIAADESPKASVNLERKLIRHGTVVFKVKDVKQTRVDLEGIVKSVHAYVGNETQTNYKDGLSYNQKVRVPADHFDALLLRVESLAEKVDRREVETEDVTEEFIDLGARLKTKTELENRYRELLAKANKVEELLSVEREIAAVRSEIESMQGRLNFLKSEVTYSTLDITFYEERSTHVAFGTRMSASMEQGWIYLQHFTVGLTSLWPFILIAIASLFLISRLYRRRAVKEIGLQS